jgi:hypothetical protein
MSMLKGCGDDNVLASDAPFRRQGHPARYDSFPSLERSIFCHVWISLDFPVCHEAVTPFPM